MILLELFLTFLEVGAVSFGGGYGMISLIREMTLSKGWLTEGELLDFIAVAESTPGPIAVNMATFVGASQAGIPGALLATFGVVLPSFLIILVIVTLVRNLIGFPSVSAILSGIRPAVVGLILATGATMLLSVLFGFSSTGDAFSPSLIGCGIFAAIVLVSFLGKKLFKRNVSPILLILFSAVLGAVFYGIF